MAVYLNICRDHQHIPADPTHELASPAQITHSFRSGTINKELHTWACNAFAASDGNPQETLRKSSSIPKETLVCFSLKIVRLRKLINCSGQFWSKIGPGQFFDLSFSQIWVYAFPSLRSASYSNNCNKKSTTKSRLKFSKKKGLSKQELRCNNCPAPKIN